MKLAEFCFARGFADQAHAALKRGLPLVPGDAKARSNYLFYLAHAEDLSPEQIYEEHRAYGRDFEAQARSRGESRPLLQSRDADRPLRIGYVSADLRSHALAHFIEPQLALLSQRPSFQLYAYSNYPLEDAVTQRLRNYFSQWVNVSELSDDALEKRIREDQIDILIDLSGHTGLNRLPVFAREAGAGAGQRLWLSRHYGPEHRGLHHRRCALAQAG